MNQNSANYSLPEFSHPELIETALTHRSALNETGRNESNERFEFLGDAVLELVSTQYLFQKFPQLPEGTLTMYRSALVKTDTLALVAKELQLGEQLIMSKGEEASGGRNNKGLLADTFEAVVGALYLDQGYDAAKKFITDTLLIHTDAILEQGLHKDPKSAFQEKVQAQGYATPTYTVVSESGPDHDKEFVVEVVVNKSPVAQGTGKSKQEAQLNAARAALTKNISS